MGTFQQLEKTKIPKGFYSTCEDIDIRIFDYDGYVAGLLSSCIDHDADIDPDSINLGDDIKHKLVDCEAKLSALKDYHIMVSETAQLLTDYLRVKR